MAAQNTLFRNLSTQKFETPLVVKLSSDDSGSHELEFEWEFTKDGRINRLGSGGFGNVYAGIESRTSVKVAVKEAMMEFPETVIALKNESKKLQKLHHRNIVQFIGVGEVENDNTLLMMMERVPGVDLYKMVSDPNNWGPLKHDQQKFFQVAKQILEGLAYLHGHGVLHRDIKGKNIMIDMEAKPPACKLCDFGLAKNMETVMASFAGTIPYMAPEAMKSVKYSQASDIWSLGCTLIEAATGKIPHSEKNGAQHQLIFAIGGGQRPKIAEDIPADLASFIEKFLIIEADQRPSAQMMLDDSDSVLAKKCSEDQPRRSLTENEAAIQVRNVLEKDLDDAVLLNRVLERLHRSAQALDLEGFGADIRYILANENFTDHVRLKSLLAQDVRARHVSLLCDLLELHADNMRSEEVCDCILKLNTGGLCPDSEDIEQKILKLQYEARTPPVWGVKGDQTIDVLETVKCGNISRWTEAFNCGPGLWKQIAGTLVQVGVGMPDQVWGVNSAGNIYRRRIDKDSQPIGDRWEQVEGGLKWVDAGCAAVWGVNSRDNIYFREGVTQNNPAGSKWVQISGGLKQVAVSPDSMNVWGVNCHDQVYRRGGITSDNLCGTGFVLVDGSLSNIAAGNHSVWGVNAAGNIFRRTGIADSDLAGKGWEQVSGGLCQVSIANTGEVWGVNKNNTIYYRLGITSDRPSGVEWLPISGSKRNIAGGGSAYVWGINERGEIYCGSYFKQWSRVSGGLKQVSATPSGLVWGTNSANDVYVRTGITSDNHRGIGWHRVPERLSYVSAGDGVWGIGNQGHLVHFRTGVTQANPIGDSWETVPGELKQISVGNHGQVWGVNSMDMILCRSGVTSFNPQGEEWVRIDGELCHVSVGDTEIWGVNVAGEIYQRVGLDVETTGTGWKRITGSMKQVSVGYGDRVYGLNNDWHIYRWNGDDWERCDGIAKDIAC